MAKPDLDRQNELEDISKIMKSRSGRRFMWRLLEGAGVFRSSFNVEPLVMAYNEGTRNQGLILLSEIMTVDSDGYILMANEAKVRLEAKEREDERRRNESES
jgi:hypothetical protein